MVWLQTQGCKLVQFWSVKLTIGFNYRKWTDVICCFKKQLFLIKIKLFIIIILLYSDLRFTGLIEKSGMFWYFLDIKNSIQNQDGSCLNICRNRLLFFLSLQEFCPSVMSCISNSKEVKLLAATDSQPVKGGWCSMG